MHRDVGVLWLSQALSWAPAAVGANAKLHIRHEGHPSRRAAAAPTRATRSTRGRLRKRGSSEMVDPPWGLPHGALALVELVLDLERRHGGGCGSRRARRLPWPPRVGSARARCSSLAPRSCTGVKSILVGYIRTHFCETWKRFPQRACLVPNNCSRAVEGLDFALSTLHAGRPL